MNNTILLQLLAKHQAGNLLPEEKKLLDDWFTSLEITDTRWYSNEQDEATQLNLLWQAIAEQTTQPVPAIAKRNHFQKYWWAAAATFFGVVISLFWMTSAKKEELAVKQSNPTSPVIIADINHLTATAPLGTVKRIILPDGSTVWLNSGASLRYPEQFKGGFRNITLVKGQAFFQVIKDNQHPFIVEGANLFTQVLGTSFEINIQSGKQVVVAVATGKVKVSQENQTELGKLIAGKKLTYHQAIGKATLSDFDPQAVALWRNKQLRLERADFSELSDALHTIYGVQVKAGDDHVLKQVYNITLRYNTTLQEITEVLATIHGNSYDIRNNTVTFKTKDP